MTEILRNRRRRPIVYRFGTDISLNGLPLVQAFGPAPAALVVNGAIGFLTGRLALTGPASVIDILLPREATPFGVQDLTLQYEDTSDAGHYKFVTATVYDDDDGPHLFIADALLAGFANDDLLLLANATYLLK